MSREFYYNFLIDIDRVMKKDIKGDIYGKFLKLLIVLSEEKNMELADLVAKSLIEIILNNLHKNKNRIYTLLDAFYLFKEIIELSNKSVHQNIYSFIENELLNFMYNENHHECLALNNLVRERNVNIILERRCVNPSQEQDIECEVNNFKSLVMSLHFKYHHGGNPIKNYVKNIYNNQDNRELSVCKVIESIYHIGISPNDLSVSVDDYTIYDKDLASSLRHFMRKRGIFRT
ncbi:MAG: hypothetical protein NZM04_03965 [Methylacidiphilales bacterium]|nr:hypothetical protein [Candidatus Methylacidiphilales bacterium]